jgi:hypothetical protein
LVDSDRSTAPRTSIAPLQRLIARHLPPVTDTRPRPSNRRFQAAALGGLGCDDPAVRVATWNLERADPAKPAGRVQADQIAKASADVWVFTEQHADLHLAGFDSAMSEQMIARESAFFATITARNLAPVPLPGVPTGCAAVVDVDAVRHLVVGVCTPWRPGQPPLPMSAVPEGTAGKEEWAAVLMRLQAALRALCAEYPGLPLVIAGDFNQTVGGPWCTGSRAGEAALGKLASDHRVTIHTADLRSVREYGNAIDHILAPSATRPAVVFLPGAVPGRKAPASDHAGYWVDL